MYYTHDLSTHPNENLLSRCVQLNCKTIVPSSVVISPEATAVLNKGLSFVPSSSSKSGLEVDINAFINKLCWKAYWENNQPKVIPPEIQQRLDYWTVKKVPSGASAPAPHPKSAFTQLTISVEKILKFEKMKIPRPPRPNVPRDVLQELMDLARREEVTFVEADKGSGIILMSRSEYHEKMYRDVLSDSNTHEEVPEDPLKSLSARFKDLLKTLKAAGKMLPEEEKLIVEHDPVLPRMFGLPKLHKQGHPMRPVVSCVRSPLAKSGNLIDNKVKPSVEAGWQFLKDSTDALQYLKARERELLNEGFSYDQMYLVSFDVASFYPSVPHETAMDAFRRARDNLELTEEQFESIERILDFHLKNAFFSFNGKFYRQKTGLPIGSAIGGPIACLALALEEDRLLERLRVENPSLAKLFEAYRRYLDDSLLMFGARTTEEAVSLADSLHGQLISMREGFDFTYTGATKKLVVLDIEVEITSEEVITRNYQKPTDKRTLLSMDSCHPTHVKSAIAYGVGLRMRRLCSRDQDFFQALRDQAWALLGRGHLEEWIRKGFAKTLMKSRDQALQRTVRTETKQTVRFVSTFDQSLDVKKSFSELKKEKRKIESTQNGTYLKSFEIQAVSRNALNLRRRLVNKAAANPTSNTAEKFGGFTKCGKCVLCRDLQNEKTVKDFPPIFKMNESFNRQRFKMPTASCQSKNVIYFAGCLKCGEFYVGETAQTVEKRCQRHRLLKTDIQDACLYGPHENWSEVRTHFALHKHENALWVTVLDVLPDGTLKRLREKKEMSRISEMQPRLNIKNNLSRKSSVNSPASVSPGVAPGLWPSRRSRRSDPTTSSAGESTAATGEAAATASQVSLNSLSPGPSLADIPVASSQRRPVLKSATPVDTTQASQATSNSAVHRRRAQTKKRSSTPRPQRSLRSGSPDKL